MPFNRWPVCYEAGHRPKVESPDAGAGSGAASYNLSETNPAWQASFSATVQPLDFARSSPGAGPLPNGLFVVFGGVGADGTVTSSVYRYTIATNAWGQIASLPIAVRDSAAVLAPNGLIRRRASNGKSARTAAQTTSIFPARPMSSLR